MPGLQLLNKHIVNENFISGYKKSREKPAEKLWR